MSTAFRQAHKAGELRFPAFRAIFKAYPRFDGLLNKLWQVTSYAHIGHPGGDPNETRP